MDTGPETGQHRGAVLITAPPSDRMDGMRDFDWLINKAYIVDGNTVHTGESVLIACLLHCKGAGRDSKDMLEVQKIMKDRNLDETK